MSCSELTSIFKNNLKFSCDESFLEESAVSCVQKSIQKALKEEDSAYKFVFVDLDDPTLTLQRFMTQLNKLFKENPSIKIEVFACSSTSGERILKRCEEAKVKFIAKPITEQKLRV